MTIEEVYENYNVLPFLRLHMYRVAGVSAVICKSLNQSVDTTSIVKAALLHDMGNIIKFDLETFEESLKPQGLSYWEDVKIKFIRQYGEDEHKATLTIARQLEVSGYVLDLIDSVGFSKAKESFQTQNLGKCIVCYSDQRVSPHKVTDIKTRTEEGKKRYKDRKNFDASLFDEIVSYLYQIEQFIFLHSDISPQDVSDQVVNEIIPSLKKFEI